MTYFLKLGFLVILFLGFFQFSFADNIFISKNIEGDQGGREALFFDANGDGYLDIYTLNGDRGNSLWVNDGDANFIAQNITGDTIGWSVAVADINGDTYPDIYNVWYTGENNLWINDGAGNFTASAVIEDTGGSRGVAVFDANGDTYLDIYIANYFGEKQNRLLINDGAGNFTESNIDGDVYDSYDVAIADLNGDTYLDIYVGNYYGGNKLWLNDGLGNFTAHHIDGDFGSAYAVAIADLNGDTYPDLYVAVLSGQNKIWINDGSANFTLKNISGDTGNASKGVAIADLNGDTYPDIYVSNNNDEQNNLWINDGSANFTVGNISGDLGDSEQGAIGDIDGDGDNDIYVPDGLNGKNNLWINHNLPSDIILSNNTVNENTSVPHTIGALSTTDLDSKDVHTYTLGCTAPGVDDADFQIVNDDELQITVSPDYETQDTYSVCIRTDDGFTTPYDEIITINVTNVSIATETPDTAPVLQSASDTGILNNDNITYHTGLSFYLECLGDSEVTLYSDGSDTGDGGSGTCSSAGTLTLTPDLSEGVQDITFVQLANTEDAGVSSESPALSVTIDTTPITPTIDTTPTQQDPTAQKTASFTLTSSEDIDTTNIDIDTFSIDTSTAPGVIITGVTFPTTKTITVTTTATGEGDITLGIAQIADIKDSAGNTSVSSTITDATVTISNATDSDGDGNPDLAEDDGPNNGDANGDGTLDSTQQSVSSITNSVTGAYTALQASGTCTLITENQIISESSLSSEDPTADYPVGLVDFQVECTNPGESVDITIYYTEVYDTSNWEYKKYDGNGSSYANITDKVTFSTAEVGGTSVTTVSFTLTDGDPETDEDGIADGIINDPSGPAITVAVTKNRSGSRRLSQAEIDAIFNPTPATEEIPSIGTDTCTFDQQLTQNMKSGDRNGQYSSWQGGIITEVKILQSHMNRLGFNAGSVDGILGPLTDAAIKRMQTSLGTIADGYVGPHTREKINTSCGTQTLSIQEQITLLRAQIEEMEKELV